MKNEAGGKMWTGKPVENFSLIELESISKQMRKSVLNIFKKKIFLKEIMFELRNVLRMCVISE